MKTMREKTEARTQGRQEVDAVRVTRHHCACCEVLKLRGAVEAMQ